jgi:hypothetical protein
MTPVVEKLTHEAQAYADYGGDHFLPTRPSRLTQTRRASFCYYPVVESTPYLEIDASSKMK